MSTAGAATEATTAARRECGTAVPAARNGRTAAGAGAGAGAGRSAVEIFAERSRATAAAGVFAVTAGLRCARECETGPAFVARPAEAVASAVSALATAVAIADPPPATTPATATPKQTCLIVVTLPIPVLCLEIPYRADANSNATGPQRFHSSGVPKVPSDWWLSPLPLDPAP